MKMPYIKQLKVGKHWSLTFDDYRSEQAQENILAIMNALQYVDRENINAVLDVAFRYGFRYRSIHAQQRGVSIRHYMGHHSPCAAIPK
jgi:hypothetical protein